MGFDFVYPVGFPAWLYAIVVAALVVCAFIAGARVIAASVVWAALSVPALILAALAFGGSKWLDRRNGGKSHMLRFRDEWRHHAESSHRFYGRVFKSFVRCIVYASLAFAIVWMFGC